MKRISKFFFAVGILFMMVPSKTNAQNFPWQRPLNYAWSSDGITFNTSSIYQDSSGVPSVIQWKGDTLICVFQWFRVPMNSITWDKVAVKFSYDNGITWTNPTPIVINGMPTNYQRAFDPTLVKINEDSLRIYFSSSDGIPMGGLDSTVNTYSAKTADGVQYYFEMNARVDEPNTRVIDPAVVRFNNAWHYASPIGAPQDGAFHYVSPNGINFTSVPIIPSDNMHNWTGNYMIEDSFELRFYGSSPNFIWYNATPNGGVWNGFVNTNVVGGDPSVVKISNNNYLMIYVGNPYPNGLVENEKKEIRVSPNPSHDFLLIDESIREPGLIAEIFDTQGNLVHCTKIREGKIDIRPLSAGSYFIVGRGKDNLQGFYSKFVKSN
jgi:hypothetical protein